MQRPAFPDVVDGGVEWLVVTRPVAENQPRLLDLSRGAGSLTQALAETETRFEKLFKMHGIAQRLVKSGQL